jgi:hypothetical protein
VKKKPAKKPLPGVDFEHLHRREARASSSLDGETQYCDACVAEQHGLPAHTCGKRPMTAEERAVVEAAMDLKKPRDPWMWTVMYACRALRAARKEGR